EKSGLAGAVAANYRQRLARCDRERQVAQRLALGAGVREADILERDLATQRLRYCSGRLLDRHDRLSVHQLGEVVEVKVVLVHPGEAAEDAQERVLHLRRSVRVLDERATPQVSGARL